MNAAESKGEFEYEPNFNPTTTSSHPFGSAATTIPTIGASSTFNGQPPKETPASAPKYNNDQDDFDFDIELNLDDNIDTSVCTSGLYAGFQYCVNLMCFFFN